ncbi:MAG: hypothetical protein QXV17_14050, partial [Candidatus Micrarchaeaceae archaeon]
MKIKFVLTILVILIFLCSMGVNIQNNINNSAKSTKVSPDATQIQNWEGIISANLSESYLGYNGSLYYGNGLLYLQTGADI